MSSRSIKLKPYVVNAILADKHGKTLRTSTSYYETEQERDEEIEQALENYRSNIEEGGEIRFLLGTMSGARVFRLEFTEVATSIQNNTLQEEKASLDIEI